MGGTSGYDVEWWRRASELSPTYPEFGNSLEYCKRRTGSPVGHPVGAPARLRTIAAAANGIGIVGVAPNVKIAGIKAGNADGFFFPEAVVCALVWAGQHQIDVTNNSYFDDPWLFNCRNDSEQHAIWKAEQRAIRFAQSRGTAVVAANEVHRTKWLRSLSGRQREHRPLPPNHGHDQPRFSTWQ